MPFKKSISKKIFKTFLLLNSTLCLLFFLSTCLIGCNQKQEAKKGYAYYCPQCRDGKCDTTAYGYSGICPVCKMQLVETKIKFKNTVIDSTY